MGRLLSSGSDADVVVLFYLPPPGLARLKFALPTTARSGLGLRFCGSTIRLTGALSAVGWRVAEQVP
jgi:hypothetical protein